MVVKEGLVMAKTRPTQLHVRGAPVGAEGYVIHLCRCPECKSDYQKYGENARERRRNCPWKPVHIHGTWSGYSNYACRCERCLSACRKTYDYAAGWREVNREHLAERARDYRAKS